MLHETQSEAPHHLHDLSEAAYRWFVICLDEDGIYTFARHQPFETKEFAEAYCKTVAQSRLPLIVYSLKPFRSC